MNLMAILKLLVPWRAKDEEYRRVVADLHRACAENSVKTDDALRSSAADLDVVRSNIERVEKRRAERLSASRPPVTNGTH